MSESGTIIRPLPATPREFWAAAREDLTGLPGGGLNIAFEAVDRHVDLRGKSVALRFPHIAPEADLQSLPGNADLRETIDLDSMDVLNLFVSFHEMLKVDVPESDYGRPRTLDGCVAYLIEKTSK